MRMRDQLLEEAFSSVTSTSGRSRCPVLGVVERRLVETQIGSDVDMDDVPALIREALSV